MSIDMSEFYQVFFEEAEELLENMEALLVDLDIENPDLEDLNAIFRVAHSIKGGAATFGFTDMAAVTHVLESLLDRLRKQELKLRSEMIDAFLQARDVIKDQLAGHRGDGQADEAAAAAVSELLTQLASGNAPAAAPAAPPATTTQAAEPEVEAAADAVAAPVVPASGKRYHVEFGFRNKRAVFDNLLNNLRNTGTVELVSEFDTTLAKDAELSFEPCVLDITTDASEEDLWEALAFVVDPALIKIEQREAASPVVSKSPATDDDGFGFFEPLYRAVVPAAAVGQKPAAQPVVPSPVAAAVEPAAVPPNPGRRAEDHADPAAAPRGRRQTDKVGGAASSDSTSIRVNIEKVDQLINLVGELVITQAMLAQVVSKLDPVTFDNLQKGMAQLDRNTRDLQESVMSIRMMPISFVFSRYPRLVRDLAGKLNKEVELKMVGESTELDKGLIEKIADPLTHLVRNSIDHGIETTEKRIAAGKPAKGTITLRAFHQGGNVVIEVMDDGAGLNREKILAKAKSQGMAVSDSMPDQEIWGLIFEAGFSTAEVVTDVSGRGVGMDVVRRNIQALGGSVEIDSALGSGTRMSIRLPLTLAILDGLSVAVGEQTFIVPLTYIVESLQPRLEDIKTVGNGEMLIHVRGEYLPIALAHEFFGAHTKNRDMQSGIIVILESDGAKKALFVDELLGQHQVVIKSLESNYRKVQGVSGATIMGNGRVALIMDAGAIVRSGGQRMLEAA